VTVARARTSNKRARQPSFAPRASFEELEIRTRDGVGLRAVVDDPPEGVPLLGTCVLAHAMLARKSEFGRRDRPGLAQAYAALGYRTVAFDFRGHGDSTSPASTREWSYDELVRFDLPCVVECARARSEDKPVFVIGHSLGGHVALAAQGTGRMSADGLVVIAANVWLRALETSRVRWAARLALGRTMREAVARFGKLPARQVRLGSDDASAAFVGDLLRFMHDDAWRSADGADDYLASLAQIAVPVCAVASDGDRLMCPPASAAALARRCGGPLEIVRISRSDDGGRAPGHMSMVTSGRARMRLLDALAWVAARV
jgi:predicted alpha/beta hydrolase